MGLDGDIQKGRWLLSFVDVSRTCWYVAGQRLGGLPLRQPFLLPCRKGVRKPWDSADPHERRSEPTGRKPLDHLPLRPRTQGRGAATHTCRAGLARLVQGDAAARLQRRAPTGADDG